MGSSNFRTNHEGEARAVSWGFTLIELQVVITIIAVLAALLMPALRYAKEQTQTVQCANNLKQFGQAIEMYGQERGYYPWGYEFSTDWSYTIQPYLGKISGLAYGATTHNLRSPIIQCPSRAYKSTNIVSCYGSHNRLLGNRQDPDARDAPAYPRVYPFAERPSDIWMVGDASQDPGNLGGESKATIENHWDMAQDYDPATAEQVMGSIGPNADTAPFGHIRWRHNRNTSANFVFVDGHVETINKNNMRLRQIRITGP